MPELPEVETIVRDLAPRVTGRTLRRPRVLKPDVLRGVSRARLVRALDGATVHDLGRRAKHIVMRLDTGMRMVIQPRMTGSLRVFDRPLRAEERRYAVFRAAIGSSETLVYRDVRRLGVIMLLDAQGWASYTAGIGPEPLEDRFTAAAFQLRVTSSRQAIKKVLMDQRRIAGVGNIYANEALFRARIHPASPANRLPSDALTRLHRAVRAVLREALAARGTTLRDYRTGTGERGSFQMALHVYGRAGEPCTRCRTHLISTHDIDGRQSTFCPRCQGRRRRSVRR